MPARTIIQLMLFLAFPSILFGQEHSYSRYEVKDGLAGSTVYSMAQDRDGFMWFATETGLSRFDGTRFRNFTTADGLPDNEIVKVEVDRKGRVWILPFRNAIAYYWRGTIHNQQNDPLLARLRIRSDVVGVLQDARGNLMIAETRTIHLIDTLGRITDLSQFGGIGMLYTNSFVDSAGRMTIIFTDLGRLVTYYATLLDKNTWAIRMLSFALLDFSVHYAAPDLEIRYTIGWLHFFDPRRKTEFRIPYPKGFIEVSRIDDTLVGINTYSGVLLLNTRRQMITDSLLTGKIVSQVTRDSEGNLWVSTVGDGIYRMASAGFLNYTFPDHGEALPVTCIGHYDSTLYVGTERFLLWKAARDERHFSMVRLVSNGTRGRVIAMSQGADGKLVVGSDFGMMIVKNGRVIRQSLQSAVKAFQTKGDSAVLVFSGNHAGWLCLPGLERSDTIFHSRTTAGLMVGDTCYIGTLAGLQVIDKKKQIRSLGDHSDLLKGRIADIKSTPDGTIWIATNGDGLVGIREGRVIVNIRDSNGLTSNVCRNIFAVDSDLWVGTDKGLNRISLKPGYPVLKVTSLDGLNSDIINAVFVDGDRVFAGTASGMTVFDQRRIQRRSECVLKMTDITAGEKKWTADTSDFTVPHRDNTLQFDFVGISFKSAGNILYRYRLRGLDDGWQSTTHNSVSFLALPSGSYQLEIQAVNKFGVKSETVRTAFTIDKRLWERNGFRIAVLLLVAAAIWIIFTLRIRRIRKVEAERSNTITRLAELEQMALRAQMNPHFIFNSLNSIQQFVMDRDVRSTNEFITKFARLIRQTLNFSSRSMIGLNEEVEYLTTYLELEKTRFEDRFVYGIDIAAEVFDLDLQIPPMILQPYVENAVRHGMGLRDDKRGRIDIRMQCVGAHLACTIEDNGVGREAAARAKGRNPIQYQSQGMRLTEKRIEMFNQTAGTKVEIRIEDLADTNSAPAGTRITVLFPLDEGN